MNTELKIVKKMRHEIIMWKRIPSGRNIEYKSTGGRVPDMYQEHNGGQRYRGLLAKDDVRESVGPTVWGLRSIIRT